MTKKRKARGNQGGGLNNIMSQYQLKTQQNCLDSGQQIEVENVEDGRSLIMSLSNQGIVPENETT